MRVNVFAKVDDTVGIASHRTCSRLVAVLWTANRLCVDVVCGRVAHQRHCLCRYRTIVDHSVFLDIVSCSRRHCDSNPFAALRCVAALLVFAVARPQATESGMLPLSVAYKHCARVLLGIVLLCVAL